MFPVQWQPRAHLWATNVFGGARRRPPMRTRDDDQSTTSTKAQTHAMRTTRTRASADMSTTRAPTTVIPVMPLPPPARTTQTDIVSAVTTISVRYPPYATNTPRAAGDAYPNDAFGGEVLGVALGAAIFAVGLARLWQILRQ